MDIEYKTCLNKSKDGYGMLGKQKQCECFGMRAGLGYFKKRNESCERSEE